MLYYVINSNQNFDLYLSFVSAENKWTTASLKTVSESSEVISFLCPPATKWLEAF